ncbi:MAG TPA: hypothetical protein VNA25_19470 [Phycisphaerae bacterium]|nr:hypothetical protein [Phycisphaerae bacterium]
MRLLVNHLAWAAAIVLPACAGCANVNLEWWKKPSSQSQPEPSAEAQPGEPATGPADDLASLKAENEILRSELDELRVRERRLAEQLKDLKFLNAQQLKQIEALADAPEQRDQYKAKAEQLEQELKRLKDQLSLLKYGRVFSEPSSQPATSTAPAGP